MVRTGKVVSNLMIDVNPSNAKLRDRAVRIVRELTGMDRATAAAALENSGWVVREAYQRLRRNPGRGARVKGETRGRSRRSAGVS